MAFYHYTCDACKIDEVAQAKMGEAPETLDCQECNGPMRRVLKAPQVQFFGSGFTKS